MKTLGIIAEYNPFHNGHFYHLTESKKITGAEICVAVMSGNFMQRGGPAMYSKWDRARAAVRCGADLVLELPFVYACNNAEYFAKGAVQILNGLSCVDYISFGSESGDITKLTGVAEIISNETPAFKMHMRESLEKGNSFPKARADAVKASVGEEAASILDGPNNILAVEYLKQLSLTKSTMAPLTITRIGQPYNSTSIEGELPCAAAIRNAFNEAGNITVIKEYVPDECYDTIKNINIDVNNIFNNLFLLICAKLLTESEENLEKIVSAGEGLGNKLKKTVRDSKDLESLISGIKSKRYTRTRVQRLLIHSLFNLTAVDFRSIADKNINYARVLAFNDNGAAFLKEVKKRDSKIPVITNINKQVSENDEMIKILHYDILASDIFNLISGNNLCTESDYYVPPYHKHG